MQDNLSPLLQLLSEREEPLTLEERQWVRALVDHPGWVCFQRAVEQELRMAVDSLRRTDSSDMAVFYRAQGASEALAKVLGLVPMLSRNPQGGTRL